MQIKMSPSCLSPPSLSARERARRPHSPAALLLLLGGAFLAELYLANLASCEPSQRASQAQPSAQQQNQFTSQELRYVPAGPNLLEDGLAMLDSHRHGSYSNAKRTRKMSAFIPMRGRKDGRNLFQSDGLQIFGSPVMRARNSAAAPFANGAFAAREFDGDEGREESLLRLLGARSLPEDADRRAPQVPRQFFNQFQARTNVNQQAQPPATGRAFRELDMDRGGGSASWSSLAEAPRLTETDAQLMSGAKLRRAFHPMRGKKAEAEPWLLPVHRSDGTPNETEEELDERARFSSLGAQEWALEQGV